MVPARFLILGSASGALQRQASESLAGRVEQMTMGGFVLADLKPRVEDRLWLRGGFPLSYPGYRRRGQRRMAPGLHPDSAGTRLSSMGRVRVPATALRRFWAMVAHYHGQIWNAAEPARALGVGESTTRRHLDLLTDAFMIRQLQPFHANLRKRQVKSPKIYVRDTGLLHQLLGIGTLKELLTHPKIGASWEGFVIEQVLSSEPHDEAFFWATHQGAEIDLVLRRGDELLGVECKRTDAPRVTRSIRIAQEDLGLTRVAVVYPGVKRYPLSQAVEAVPLSELARPGSLFTP